MAINNSNVGAVADSLRTDRRVNGIYYKETSGCLTILVSASSGLDDLLGNFQKQARHLTTGSQVVATAVVAPENIPEGYTPVYIRQH